MRGLSPSLALTATATPYVRSDIIEQLSLRDPRAFVVASNGALGTATPVAPIAPRLFAMALCAIAPQLARLRKSAGPNASARIDARRG